MFVHPSEEESLWDERLTLVLRFIFVSWSSWKLVFAAMRRETAWRGEGWGNTLQLLAIPTS